MATYTPPAGYSLVSPETLHMLSRLPSEVLKSLDLAKGPDGNYYTQGQFHLGVGDGYRYDYGDTGTPWGAAIDAYNTGLQTNLTQAQTDVDNFDRNWSAWTTTWSDPTLARQRYEDEIRRQYDTYSSYANDPRITASQGLSPGTPNSFAAYAAEQLDKLNNIDRDLPSVMQQRLKVVQDQKSAVVSQLADAQAKLGSALSQDVASQVLGQYLKTDEYGNILPFVDPHAQKISPTQQFLPGGWRPSDITLPTGVTLDQNQTQALADILSDIQGNTRGSVDYFQLPYLVDAQGNRVAQVDPYGVNRTGVDSWDAAGGNSLTDVNYVPFFYKDPTGQYRTLANWISSVPQGTFSDQDARYYGVEHRDWSTNLWTRPDTPQLTPGMSGDEYVAAIRASQSPEAIATLLKERLYGEQLYNGQQGFLADPNDRTFRYDTDMVSRWVPTQDDDDGGFGALGGLLGLAALAAAIYTGGAAAGLWGAAEGATAGGLGALEGLELGGAGVGAADLGIGYGAAGAGAATGGTIADAALTNAPVTDLYPTASLGSGVTPPPPAGGVLDPYLTQIPVGPVEAATTAASPGYVAATGGAASLAPPSAVDVLIGRMTDFSAENLAKQLTQTGIRKVINNVRSGQEWDSGLDVGDLLEGAAIGQVAGAVGSAAGQAASNAGAGSYLTGAALQAAKDTARGVMYGQDIDKVLERALTGAAGGVAGAATSDYLAGIGGTGSTTLDTGIAQTVGGTVAGGLRTGDWGTAAENAATGALANAGANLVGGAVNDALSGQINTGISAIDNNAASTLGGLAGSLTGGAITTALTGGANTAGGALTGGANTAGGALTAANTPSAAAFTAAPTTASTSSGFKMPNFAGMMGSAAKPEEDKDHEVALANLRAMLAQQQAGLQAELKQLA